MDPSIFQAAQTQYPFLDQYKYLLLFLGGAIEGLNTMIVGGFLVSIDRLAALPTLIVLVLAYTVNGYIWYALGYWGGAGMMDWWAGRKPSRRQTIAQIRGYFERHTGWAIVIAKTTLSLTIATLVLAGSLKYRLRKFTWYNFLGSIGWVAVTFSVGYFFGQGYRSFFYLRNVVFILIGVMVTAIIVYLSRRFLTNLYMRSLAFTEHLREINQKIKDGIQRFTAPEDEE